MDRYTYSRGGEKFSPAADGSPIRIVGFAQDITEVKQAEDALRESEKKYRLIVENAQEGICATDTEAKITFANSRMAEMVGYTVHEMIGKPACAFVGKDDVRMGQYYFGRCKRGITEWIEYKFVHKDGSWVYTSLGISPIIDDDGHFIGALALATDITERKRAEDALRKQAQIINQIHDSVISTDLDGYVTSWNKGAERLFGYTEKEVLGRHISFLYPEDEQDVLKYKVIAPLKEKGTHEVEVRSRGKTGEDIYVHLSLSLLRDNAGNVIGMIGSSMDITERKRAEEEKEKIQAQLLQSQKMEAIGILAGGVAHDFNNLLTTIQGYTTLAMMELPDSDPLSRDLEPGTSGCWPGCQSYPSVAPLQPQAANGACFLQSQRTIDDLLKMLYRLIGEDITITTELEPDLWSIRADEGTIEQVIMNLAVNARDAMPKGGKLTIKTENVILDEEACQAVAEARPGQFVRLTDCRYGNAVWIRRPSTGSSSLFSPPRVRKRHRPWLIRGLWHYQAARRMDYHLQ